MTPPPTNIDGTDITGATIDGQDVQEITVDGQTVFTAVDIPDSAIHRYKLDEGSGTFAADDIGTADGQISGATFTSGTFVGGFALDFDGSDDFLELPATAFTGSTTFSISFTIQTTTTANTDLFSSLESAGSSMLLQVNDSNSGDLRFLLRGSSGNIIAARTSSGGLINDGSKHRVVCTKSGNNGDDLSFAIDGSGVSTTTTTDNPYSPTALTFNPYFGARNVGGTDSFHTSCTGDDILIFDQELTASQIQTDYDRQPWV